MHAVVAQSTFWKSKVLKTDGFGALLEVEMFSGAKHTSKSKCTKHVSLGTCLEVEMLEKCMPLWREAHSEVKMYKAPHA